MDKLDTLFKAYDVRGRTPQELDARLAHDIGRAFGDFVGEGSVAVGYDMRADSEELARAVIEGLVRQGRQVLNIGRCTTDTIYFAVGKLGLGGGVMITASHNAAGYNGIKFTGAGVVAIGQDNGLGTIKDIVRNQSFRSERGDGSVAQQDLTKDFVQHAISVAEKNFGKLGELRIGYDAGNGMAGQLADLLAILTPLKIYGLYLQPDGNFPNHPANPMIDQNLHDLRDLVAREKLICGAAFDGDGDRAFFVDENRMAISSSVLGSLLAREILEHNPGATVVYGANCSHIVPETIRTFGGEPSMSRVGHSFIKDQMHRTGAIFGIEHAGHFYFAENWHADSGLITALCTLALLSNATQPLSALVAPFRKYANSGEINFTVHDTTQVMEALKEEFSAGELSDIDGITISFSDYWFNVRASNTEPLLRLNVEAKDQATMHDALSHIERVIQKNISR